MALNTWLLYLAAALGLSLTPGPNSMLAITHGALYGHARTVFTILGGALGFVLIVALAMAGIGTLLQASAHALTLLKWLGGAYLIWLGIQIWRAPPIDLRPGVAVRDEHASVLFRQGWFAAVSNPKALIFFGAFLPQFIDPARGLFTQFVLMALTFAVIECVVEYLLARLAHVVRPALQRAGRRFNRFCGGVFVLIGAALPISR